MKLYKKFSNLFDVNKIKQLSNKDILIASSNKLKIYSITSFENIYKISEINNPIISIYDIAEIDISIPGQILLAISLSNFSIQLIRLMIKNTSKKKIYKHKLVQEIKFNLNIKIKKLCINSFLGQLIISINNKIFYYQNQDKEKIKFNSYFQKEEESGIKNEVIIKGITSLKNKNDNLIITLEEKNIIINKIINKSFDLKIYYFENLELITILKDLNIYPEKGLMSFMTYFNQDKPYLIIADGYDKLILIKMYDDFDIYDEIYLLKSIKELSSNKFNKSEYYDIMSICGLNNGTFIICLYYKESLNEKNYLIKGKINLKSRKFELLDINNNAHNNKTNFITSSEMVNDNSKFEQYFCITGDHEGVLKIWKI
jgi:hypothetical protein